jgi:hypothetical protein
MANRQRGEVTLTLDGHDYILRLTVEATAQLEDACSTPDKEMFFPDIYARVLKGSAKHTRLFVWALLREHHPKMTVGDAGALIDAAGGMVGFAGQVAAVMKTTEPDPEDAPRPPVAQAVTHAGTGARSTSRRARSA